MKTKSKNPYGGFGERGLALAWQEGYDECKRLERNKRRRKSK